MQGKEPKTKADIAQKTRPPVKFGGISPGGVRESTLGRICETGRFWAEKKKSDEVVNQHRKMM